MSKTAIITKKDGTSFECPVHAVKNFRRMLSDQIASVSIKGAAPVAAPSVEPVEETVIPHPEADETPEEVAPEASDENDTDGDKPNVRWTKAQLQEHLRENHPEIDFQANDTKAMLLNFIKAANK